MSWQIRYALEYFSKDPKVTSVQHVRGDAIKIIINNQPDILAVISASNSINADLAIQYHREFPEIDFICGYRKECIWGGDAISYLEDNMIGWGNAGTLGSALYEDNAKTAAHKDFFFADRLIRQVRSITNIVREFDRIHTVMLARGGSLRIGMIKEYEPTADTVRTLWAKFGPVDIAWNINPNGSPTLEAIKAGDELGCKVMRWEELKLFLKNG